MSVSDTAVGAILEIPPELLRDIKKAEQYIEELGKTSQRVANEVSGHWSAVATGGLDAFIRKLQEATGVMSSISGKPIEFNVNTNQAQSNVEQLSNTTKKTTEDISDSVQNLGRLNFDFSQPKESLEQLIVTFKQLEAELKHLQSDRSNLAVGSTEAQGLNNVIEALKEYISLKKMSDAQLRTKITETDKPILEDQKRLLAEQLDLRKKINEQKKIVESGKVTGSEKLENEKKTLERLWEQYQKNKQAREELNRAGLSDAGQARFDISAEKQKNDLLAMQLKFQRDLNSELAKANEYTAQAQANKARISNTDEGRAQRQLNSDYKAMINILKEVGDIKAKAAEQGRSVNQNEVNLIQSLCQRYAIYREDINRVSGAFANLAEARKKAFESDRTEQLTRNAIALADAQKKAADAAQKVADAQAKTAQQKADKDRSHAESELNKLYTERLRLLKEKEQLENKALINTAKGLPDLTAKENQLLAEVTAKIATIDGQIKNISNTYHGLALKAQHAFALDELRQATALQNQFNKALDAVDTSRTKQLVAEYKKLYTENKRIQKSLDAANKLPVGTMTPQAYQTYNILFAEQGANFARMAQIEKQNIQEVADFRRQKDIEYNQQSISAFVQAEAQKTAKAKKQAKKQSNDRLQAYQKFLNSYQGAMAAANRLGTRGGQWEDTYENRARVIKNLEAAIKNLNKTDTDYERKLKDLTDALNKLKSAQDAVKNAMKPVVSPQDAINMAKNASTLRELEAAYKALKEAMANTKTSDPQWTAMNTQLEKTKTHIDEIKKKMGEFQSQASKTSGVVSQLQGRIAAAFSIGAINGFIKKMVETRAQFELQRVALGAIIQDRDEANKIFTQVQNMALESPFSIMQLERATKQIAAFGFEAKKLVPTMKMFADISAGLGVEIDRLVLVMGHLKARNFLEGTMVRQFTNMGFNILGELSKYYQDLEGKMVSVGEVQDRVKKKMVSFADVEEVLKRVTSAGGMFYDMQKKQSDSIWGQMQRITDAYDLMLNEIGQSNEGSIKMALTAIRTLINSWRSLVPIIQAAGTAMIVYSTVTKWSALTAGVKAMTTAFKNLRTVIWGTKAAQDALNASQKANAWGLLASVIAAAAVAIYDYATAQSKLNESLDRVRNEGIGNMYELLTQYKQLADTVRDTNKPFAEQKQALDEIKRIYAEILPAEMLEIKNIKAMTNGYEEATAAIKAFSAEKIKANLKSEIQNIVGSEISSQEIDLADWITFSFTPDEMPKNTFRAYIKTILAEVSEEVKNGSIPVENALSEFKKRTTDRLGNIVSQDWLERFNKISTSTNLMLLKNIREWRSSLQKYQDEMSGVDIGIDDAESRGLVLVKDKYEQVTTAVDNYKKAIEALRVEREKGTVTGDVTTDENGNFVAKNDGLMGAKALENLNKSFKEVQENAKCFAITWDTTADDVNAAIESQTGQMGYFEQVNETVFSNILKGFNNWNEWLRKDKSVEAWVQNANRAQDALDLSPIQNKILGIAKNVTVANNMQIGSLDRLRLESLNSFSDAAKAAQSVYNQLAANELAIQTQIKSLVQYGYAANEAKAMAEEQFGAGLSLEEIKEMMKLYKELVPAFGGIFKDSNKPKNSSDKELKRWQDLKKAIEDVRTAYEKYRKSYNVEESNARIEKLFGPAFKELGHDISEFYKDGKYDAEALIDALEVLKGMTKATTEERKKFRSEIERKIGTTQVEIEVKMKEDAEKKLKADLDEMFANYELSEELKKIGVSVDLTYMVGGKPTTLSDIRREIYRLRSEGGDKADAENRIKILEEAEKKMIQIEEKNQRQRMKNYIKYLTESMAERAQIEIKALQDVNKIREDATLDQFSKEQAIMQRRKKMNEDLSKMDLDSLKSSDVYISVFKDLERASKEQLQYVLNKLKELQSTFKDLSPAQVKSIASEMKKIEDALADKDSIKRLGTSLLDTIRYARQRNDLLKEQAILQAKIGDYDKTLQSAQTELYQLELNRASIQDKNTEEWKEANEAVQKQRMYVLGLQSQISVLRDQLKAVTNEIDNGESAWKRFQSGLSKVQNGINQAKESLDAVFTGLDSMGLVNDAFRDTYESIGEILGGVDTFMSGLGSMDITKPFSIITGGVKAIGGIFQSIGGIFSIGDKKKERQIKRLAEKVEDLDKAYQKLEKSIEAAYTFNDYNAGYKQMQDNLEAQKIAYEEMIRLEEAKKKTDKEKVKEYKEKLEEIAEAEEELRKERIEVMGSTTDYLSEAQSFVDAWLEAYKETGNGLDALSESWEEFIEGLFVKQGAAQIVSARLQKVIQQINDAIESGATDFDLADAVNKAREDWKKEAETIEPLLEQLFGSYGLGKGNGDFILSDLQKGIQNITEPQAAAIEAYLNSMRFAVFRHTEQLDTLITTIQAQYGSGAENPVVTELKGIRGVLDNIYSTLRSVVKTQTGKTGIVIVG